MGCNCGKKNRKTFNPAPPPTLDRSIQPISRQAGPAPQQDSRCRVCGWVLKRTKYIDVTTHSKVERIDCTNAKCPGKK